MTGSAFALAEVSTSASGIDNFSNAVNVLVDTGNLLTIGLCVFHTANGASENSAMHSVGETIVYIKCDNFSSILSGAVELFLKIYLNQ